MDSTYQAQAQAQAHSSSSSRNECRVCRTSPTSSSAQAAACPQALLTLAGMRDKVHHQSVAPVLPAVHRPPHAALPWLRGHCPGSEGTAQVTCAAQVSVVVHPAGWDDSEGWDYIQQQEYPTPAQQQQQQAADWQVLGPIQTTLKHYKDGRVACQKVNRDGKLTPYNKEDYTLVLQERASWSRHCVKLSYDNACLPRPCTTHTCTRGRVTHAACWDCW